MINDNEIYLNYTHNIYNDNINHYPNDKYLLDITANNKLTLSFEAIYFFTSDDAITPAKTFDLKKKKKTINQISLDLGQKYYMFFKPVIIDNDVALNLQLEHFNKLDSSNIQIELYPHSNPFIARYEKIRKYDCKYIQLY